MTIWLRGPLLSGALLLAGCSTGTDAVDFATLQKTWKPNQYLVCPPDYCRGSPPDQISPAWPLDAADLMARLRPVLLAQPRTELVHEAAQGRQLVLVQRTERVGFPDTVFVEAVGLGPRRSAIAIYSRSNYGIGDRGGNAARVAAWLALIEKAASSP